MKLTKRFHPDLIEWEIQKICLSFNAPFDLFVFPIVKQVTKHIYLRSRETFSACKLVQVALGDFQNPEWFSRQPEVVRGSKKQLSFIMFIEKIMVLYIYVAHLDLWNVLPYLIRI